MDDLNDWLNHVSETRITYIDWLHVLERVPLEDKVRAGKLVLEDLDLFDDYK